MKRKEAQIIGERIVPAGADSSIEDILLYARHLFAYEEAEKFSKGKKVLEIGCGSAYGTALLARAASKTVALDIDSSLIKSLSQHKKPDDAVDYRWFDGKMIPFSENYFDIICSFQVLEHVSDPIAFVREMKRVLDFNGVILMTTPNRLMRLLPGQKPFNNFHVREFEAKEIVALAESVPISVDIQGVFGDSLSEDLEVKRLQKYHSWWFRHIFQNLPKGLQDQIKIQVLRWRKTPISPAVSVADLHFCRDGKGSIDRLKNAIDLWIEMRHLSA